MGRTTASRHHPAWHRKPDARSRTCHRRRPTRDTRAHDCHELLDAAIVLSRASRLEVYNIGGTVSPITRAQEGDWAVREMERLHVDVSVVCPAGISVERGLTQATPAAAAVSQVEVASGELVIALAGADSFGVSAFVQFASLDQIDSIAVAGSPSEAALQPFVERGITITVGGTS